jgi:hypothetical protein
MALKFFGCELRVLPNDHSGHAQQRIAAMRPGLDADFAPSDRRMNFDQTMTSINTLEDR